MKKYLLEFKGYTWDEYFYIISNRSGVLIAYKGMLDSEGSVKMSEIIYVGGADNIGVLYESKKFADIRKLTNNSDMLFFSYAEMGKEGREEVVSTLIRYLHHPQRICESTVRLTCIGACALFPQEILK